MDNRKIAIVAWRKLSRRSQLISKALNAKIWFFRDGIPYIRASLGTLLALIRERPHVTLVQLPQGPLLLETLLLKTLRKYKVVADVHSGFLVTMDWKGWLLNTPFVRFLQKADLILVHNDLVLNLIPMNLRAKTLVVLDPWYLICNGEHKTGQGDYIVFPASFAPDEPLEEVINSINSFNLDVKIYVTGNWKRQPRITKYASDKIKFTGYLKDGEYYKLLLNAKAIVTGTKREYTSLMSAWEAIAYTKPLALTKTKTLENLFKDYAVFYDWRDSRSIVNAVKTVLSSKPDLRAREKLKIKALESIDILKRKLLEFSM
jgi:glycosyltransferase involved in cell wall biosynthesis